MVVRQGKINLNPPGTTCRPTVAATLPAATTGTETEPDREIRLRAFALIGQIMAVRFARETLVRHLGLEGYSPHETAEIRAVVLEQTRAALSGLRHLSG